MPSNCGRHVGTFRKSRTGFIANKVGKAKAGAKRQSFSNVKSAATEKIIEVIKCVNFASLFSQHYSASQKIDMERI